MATKSDNIRYTQLKQQIVDIYEKASAGITNENELDKSVINALNDGSFDVFYGDQLTGLKPQKFDFILNPEDHPADHIDYYDGEVIDKPQQAMSWELYLDTYKTEDPYSVILVRKKTEHTNPHIQQAKLGTNIKTKRMRKQTLSQKANYVPNRMINEVEVERNGKVTFVDGANRLDGVYVKKGVKYAGGGQMNETFPDVDGQDNMSFMAGGKVKKRELLDYDEYDYEDEDIFDKKPNLIVKNNVDDEWGDVKVWYKGKKTIVLSSDPGGYGAPALQIEGIVKDQDELLSYAKGLAGTDEEGDIFSSDTGVKDLNFYMNDWLQDLLRQFEKWGGEDLSLTLYSDKVLKVSYSDSKKVYAQRDAERKLGQILIDEGWAKREKYKVGSDDAIVDESLMPYIKSGKAYINDAGLLVVDTDKAKRGTTIKNKQMAESTTKRRFDKMYKASKPGERKSKKFAKIERMERLSVAVMLTIVILMGFQEEKLIQKNALTELTSVFTLSKEEV